MNNVIGSIRSWRLSFSNLNVTASSFNPDKLFIERALLLSYLRNKETERERERERERGGEG
jgi:hypothetical protein